MVKLEDMNGNVVFVEPAHVTSINVGLDEKSTCVWDVGGYHIAVKGTPDEVHAKLFPRKATRVRTWEVPEGADFYDVNEVVRYVADAVPDSNGKIHALPHVVALARKALGREGA